MKKIFYIINLMILSLILVSCRKVYKVTFDLNGGTGDIKTQEIKKNKLATKPANPTIENGSFEYWMDEAGNEFLFTTKITKNYNLKASYALDEDIVDETVELTVTFVLNNDEDNIEVTFNKNSLIEAPTNITNGDLALVGWYLDHEFQEGYWNLLEDKLIEDITLYARWAETYTNKTTQNMENGNLDSDASINNAFNMGLEPAYFNVKAIKGASTIPGYYSNEIRLYVGGALEFSIHESFVISKVEISFGTFNNTPGLTEVTLGNTVNEVSNQNNKIFKFEDLNITNFKIHNVSKVTAERVYIKYIEITYYQIGPDVVKEEDINRPVIDISEYQLIELELGEIFDPESIELTATDIEDGEVTVLYDRDTININNYGIYYVFFYAIDSDEYRSDAYITVIVREVDQVLNYYDDIDVTKEGNDLKLELRSLLNSTLSLVNYEVGNISMEISDRDPNNFNNVWLIYNSVSIRGGWNATNWAKEHVWAKSAFGSDTKETVYSISATPNGYNGIGSDLHNLRTINPSVNSSHSNYEFGDDNGDVTGDWQRLTLSERLHNPYTPGKENDKTTSVFYPGDEHKGDVARILLYMNTLWDIVTREDISMLLRWHLEDPVDTFEIIRNEVIFSYQGNRNPYIDYPDLLESVYAN